MKAATILDDLAQAAARTAALAAWEEDREWLLNPFRPVFEKLGRDLDDDGRERIVKALTEIAEQIRRSVN